MLFSNVNMLKRIETESRRTRQIKKWLVLLSRMLAIACLVIAFAQPVIPLSNSVKGRVLQAVYLDNSFSMNSRGEKGQLFEQAKNAARSLVNGLDRNARVLMLANSRTGIDKVLSKERAVEWIDELELSSEVNELRIVSSRVEYLRAQEGFDRAQVYLLSDHQKMDRSEWEDSLLNYVAIDLSPQTQRNLAIDTLWLSSPINKTDEPISLVVRLKNFGLQDIQSATLGLKVNGAQQGAESFSLKAESSKDIELTFTSAESGWINGELYVSDQTVQFDNTYYFTLKLKERFSVLVLSEQESLFNAVFEEDEQFELTTSTPLSFDQSKINSYDMIVLDQIEELSSALSGQLNTFMQDGGVLLCVPSSQNALQAPGLNINTYGRLKSIGLSIRTQDLKHPFFSGVYARIPENSIMPKVISAYSLSRDANSEMLLGLKNGDAVLTRRAVGRGYAYQYSMPMAENFTNIYEHELFVLVALKAAFSKNSVNEIAYRLNSQDAIPLDAKANEKALVLSKGDLEVLLESSASLGKFRFWLNSEVREAGIYELRFQNEEDLQALLALNNDRRESVQEYHDRSSYAELLGSDVKWYSDQEEELQTLASIAETGRPLWKLFILFSLIFLLIEILLLRFLKS